MRTFTTIVAILVLLCGSSPVFGQQDPQYSQYMFNPMVLNPAYAGSRGITNGSLVLRKQWVGMNGAPSTQGFAFNSPTKKGRVGLGLQIIADQIGPKSAVGVKGAYAYRLPLGKGKLAFGLGAGFTSFRINWQDINYKDKTDDYALLSQESRTIADFDFGVYYNTKSFYTGISATHLNRGVYGIANDTLDIARAYLRTHNFFTIGKAFELNENVIFSPSVIVKSVLGLSSPNVDLNMHFQFKNTIWAGVSVRTDRSLVVMAQYRIADKLRIGYAYDLTTSKLRTATTGSHEIMLGYDVDLFKVKTISPRYF